METITIQAHFDGKHILLDEPVELQPGAKLLVTIVPSVEAEREEWLRQSLRRLEDAFGGEEPEYSLSLIKKQNPDYDRR